jgi:hypothetical protein
VVFFSIKYLVILMATAITYSTNIKTNDISAVTGNLLVSSQSSFTFAPHCAVAPSTAEDLTNKAYVDTRLVNSGSGTNLYFNQSVVQIAPYKQLSTSIIVTVPPTTQTVVINHPAGGTNTLIQRFITDSGFPGTVTIPAGIWVLNQFGNTNLGGTIGILEYFFILSKRPLVGVDVVLGTSGVSADVNTSVTDIFFAQLALGAQTLLATDRLIIDIYAKGIGPTNPSNTLTSSYEGNTYSYITTPLVSGSNFLSLNNTFTGSNSFTQLVTMSGTMPAVTTTSDSSAPSITFVSDCIANRLIPYLTTATAASTYLTQANAALTYLTLALASTTYLTIATAASTYLTIATAASTYLTIATAASTYLTQANAATTYLTIANAASTYLTQALGVALAGTQTITGAKSFSSAIGLSYTTLPTFTSTQIGYTLNIAVNGSFTIPAYSAGPPAVSAHNMQTITLPLGVWNISAGCRYGGGGGQNFSVGISNVIDYLQNFSPTSLGITDNTFANSNFIANGPSTYYFVAQNNLATTVAVDSIFIQITRIA